MRRNGSATFGYVRTWNGPERLDEKWNRNDQMTTEQEMIGRAPSRNGTESSGHPTK